MAEGEGLPMDCSLVDFRFRSLVAPHDFVVGAQAQMEPAGTSQRMEYGAKATQVGHNRRETQRGLAGVDRRSSVRQVEASLPPLTPDLPCFTSAMANRSSTKFSAKSGPLMVNKLPYRWRDNWLRSSARAAEKRICVE